MVLLLYKKLSKPLLTFKYTLLFSAQPFIRINYFIFIYNNFKISFINNQWHRGRSAENKAVEPRVQITCEYAYKTCKSVMVVLLQKSVHCQGILHWKCPLSSENPDSADFNHAGNKYHQAERLVLRHLVRLAE